MAHLRGSLGRFWPLFLAVAVQGALLSVPHVTLVAAQEGPPPNLEQLFVNVNSPVGLAVNPSGLGYVTRPLCGSTRQVLRFTSTRRVTVFATLPSFGAGDPTCYEHKIAVAPGPKDNTAPTEGGYPTLNSQTARFVSNEIYVTSPKTTPGEGGSSQKVLAVLKIALDLNALINQHIVRYRPPTTFATFPACDKNASTGITFDKVGTFGFKLIVVCSNPASEGTSFGGKVYTLANNGAKTLVATIPTDFPGPFERPVVAPLGAPWNGNLLIPAENSPANCFTRTRDIVASTVGSASLACPPNGQVLAVTGEGTIAVADVPSAEAVAVKLDTVCNFGLFNLPQGATYFAAKSGATPGGNRIDFIPRAPFAGKSGQAFIVSENAEGGVGIWRLAAPFTTPIPFSASSTTHEDAAFVDCFVPTLHRIKITGRDRPFVDVAIIPIPGRFDPAAQIDFDGAILTPLASPLNQPNHPVPGSCRRGERGGDREKSRKDKDQVKVKKADDDEDGDDDDETEGAVHCTFPNNIGSQVGVFKGPYRTAPGDGSEGGC